MHSDTTANSGPASSDYSQRRDETRYGIIWRKTRGTILPPGITAAVVLIAWQIGSTAFGVPVYVLPTPLQIVHVYSLHADLLWFHTEYTLFEAGTGLALGVAIGMLFGTAFAMSRPLERAFVPWVVAATTVPIVAVTPILLLVLGQGPASKIAVTAFGTFFPVCLNTMKGLRSTPAVAIELMHVNAATAVQQFFKVRVPYALPYFFVGLKLAATFSVIAAIVAEFVGSSRGLGYLMLQSSFSLDSPTLWASMLASALMGIAMFLIVLGLEKRFVRWHEAISL